MSGSPTSSRRAGADRQWGGQLHGGEAGQRLGGGRSSLECVALRSDRDGDTGTHQVAQRLGCVGQETAVAIDKHGFIDFTEDCSWMEAPYIGSQSVAEPSDPDAGSEAGEGSPPLALGSPAHETTS